MKLSREERVGLTNNIYDSIKDSDLLKLAKHKLPLNIKLFNKIDVHGYGMSSDEQKIELYITLSKRYEISVDYTLEELMKVI